MKKTTTLLLLVLVTVAPVAAQKLEKINPPGLSKPASGTYTQIVRAGKLLFIAGQTATNSEGKVVGPGMKEQVDQVFANLLIALKSQGADFSEVVKMTSVDSRPEPEPDLLCIHVDGPVAFELVSLTDSAIAKMQAAGQKAHQDAFYTSDPAWKSSAKNSQRNTRRVQSTSSCLSTRTVRLLRQRTRWFLDPKGENLYILRR